MFCCKKASIMDQWFDRFAISDEDKSKMSKFAKDVALGKSTCSLFLVGPSPSGKSTIAEYLAALVSSSSHVHYFSCFREIQLTLCRLQESEVKTRPSLIIVPEYRNCKDKSYCEIFPDYIDLEHVPKKNRISKNSGLKLLTAFCRKHQIPLIVCAHEQELDDSSATLFNLSVSKDCFVHLPLLRNMKVQTGK